MIEGIEILHQTDIMGPPDWLLTAIIVGVPVVWILFVVCTRKVKIFDMFIRFMLGGVCAIVYMIAMLCLFGATKPTGRYRYDVTIDETVNFKEIYDRFDIIDKRGDIYTLEDKER